MPRPKLIEIIALALLSLLVVLPFHPENDGIAADHFFEVDMASSATGEIRLYFDDGSGLRESLACAGRVAAGDDRVHYRLRIPNTTLRTIRVDPINAPAHITLSNARITRADGTTERTFHPESFLPTYEIEKVTIRDGVLEVATSPTGVDPQLTLRLEPELRPTTSVGTPFAVSARRAVIAFALGLLIWFLLVGAPFAASARAWIAAQSATHPRRFVTLLAAASAVASSYPIIFLGRSFVSPNYSDGTILLYPRFPTLPGYEDARLEDAKGSDVGAMAWQHGPSAMVQHDALFEHGELPLWNRYSSAGSDLLGQGQLKVGDPLNMLVVAADGAAWAWDATYVAAKFIFALTLGLAALAATRWAPAGWLTAATAPFIGFFVHRVNHPAFFSLCYAPIILLAWLRITRARDLREMTPGMLLLVLGNLIELTSGTVKEAYMLIVCLNFAGMLVLVCAEHPLSERLRRLAILVVAGFLFALLAAPVWVTFLSALKSSYTSYNAPSALQIHPALALGFFDELFYRPLHAENRVWNPSVSFLVLIALAYVAATWRRTESDRTRTALVLAALPPLALAFGLVPRAWIVEVPFLANIAHIDNTFSCVLIVLALVLAGFGWKAAAERLGTRESMHDLALVGLLIAAIVIPWIATQQVVHREPFGAHTFFPIVQPAAWGPCVPFIWVSLGALLAASTVLVFVLRAGLRRGNWRPTDVIVLLACTYVLLWRFGAHAQTRFDAFVYNPAVRVNFHAPSPAIEYIRSRLDTPARVVGLENVLMPGWSQAYRIEGIGGPDALMVPEYRELVEAGGIDRIWDWRPIIHAESLVRLQRVYDLLNIRFFLDATRPIGVPEDRFSTCFTGDLVVMENRSAWPRAFFTDRAARVSAMADIITLAQGGDGRPFAAVLPSEASRINLPSSLEDRTVIPARAYTLTPNTTTFEIDAPQPGIAVLHEAWQHRDFEATVDGRRVPVVRMNGAFMAVEIAEAGHHVVRFAFRPRYLDLALAASLLGVVGIATLSWWLRRRAAPAA